MRSGIPDPGIPSDWLILTVFVNSGASSITSKKWDMEVMTDSTFRPEFELATNTALSHSPNVEAKREEQRKHVVGRIDVFAISPTGFGKRLIFQLFPRIKRALE